jgi:PadR family transcriptional regulator AphA
MPRNNKTRYALLGVLAAGPASGYDIKKFCDKSIAYFWNENYGHIYPVLKELEREGLIAGETAGREGRPPRTVYRITDEGRGEFERWLMRPVEPAPVRHELLLKLVFAGNAPAGGILAELRAARRRYEAHLSQYAAMERAYEAYACRSKDKDAAYWLSALRFGIMETEFRIRWCDETLERLGKANG